MPMQATSSRVVWTVSMKVKKMATSEFKNLENCSNIEMSVTEMQWLTQLSSEWGQKMATPSSGEERRGNNEWSRKGRHRNQENGKLGTKKPGRRQFLKSRFYKSFRPTVMQVKKMDSQNKVKKMATAQGSCDWQCERCCWRSSLIV